jgi:RNAse (barnase) inhibitor barstar
VLGGLEKMIRIDADGIVDWETFHAVFASAFGFPDFYGCNMNAWIDCLTYLDEPEAEMTNVHVASGESLTLIIDHAGQFKSRCPEQFAALVECAGFVNWRRIDIGNPPVLMLAFYA